MPKANYYPAIDVWNAIIDIVANDDYLSGSSGLFTNSRTAEPKTHYMPLNALTIPAYPALSISFEGEMPIQDITTQKYEVYTPVYKIMTAFQTGKSDIKEAITDSVEALIDIKQTIQEVGKGNLNKTCRNYNFTSINPVQFFPDRALWTVMHEMKLVAYTERGNYA